MEMDVVYERKDKSVRAGGQVDDTTDQSAALAPYD